MYTTSTSPANNFASSSKFFIEFRQRAYAALTRCRRLFNDASSRVSLGRVDTSLIFAFDSPLFSSSWSISLLMDSRLALGIGLASGELLISLIVDSDLLHLIGVTLTAHLFQLPVLT